MEVTQEHKMEVSASLPNPKSSPTKLVATAILTENMCKLPTHYLFILELQNFQKPESSSIFMSPHQLTV